MDGLNHAQPSSLLLVWRERVLSRKSNKRDVGPKRMQKKVPRSDLSTSIQDAQPCLFRSENLESGLARPADKPRNSKHTGKSKCGQGQHSTLNPKPILEITRI